MEYKLLVLLSEHTGKVLTYNFILKAVWERALETELPPLRVFMTTLRKKIEEDPKKSDLYPDASVSRLPAAETIKLRTVGEAKQKSDVFIAFFVLNYVAERHSCT